MKTCNPVAEPKVDLRPVVYVVPDTPMSVAAILATIEDSLTFFNFGRRVKSPCKRTVQRKLEDIVDDLGFDIKDPNGSDISEYQGAPVYSAAIAETALNKLGFQVKPLSEAPFIPLAYGK